MKRIFQRDPDPNEKLRRRIDCRMDRELHAQRNPAGIVSTRFQ